MVAATLASVAACVTVAPAAASAQDDGPAKPKLAGPNEKDPLSDLEAGEAVELSDEKKVTRWANAAATYPIRKSADKSSRTITRLRYSTEDDLPEVYLILEGKVDESGVEWLRIRIPMRPNGRTGWVPSEMLTQIHVVRTRMVIDRKARKATLYKSGRRIWSARVGIGKKASPTPRGNFWIRERLRGDGKVYGNWAFGTSAYSNLSDWPKGGVVGIHGTNQPGLIPGRISHGCVRVKNSKMSQLARRMPIGTPVQVIR